MIPGSAITGLYRRVAAASMWNPSDKTSDIALSGADLVATSTASAYHGVRGTTSKSSGKWYFEVTATFGNSLSWAVGVAQSSFDMTQVVTSSPNAYIYRGNGTTYNSTSSSTTLSAASSGNVIQVAVDLSTGKIWWGLNGTWMGGGNPSGGTGEAFTISGAPTVFPLAYRFTNPSTNTWTANFGGSAFAYSPPSGYSAWG